MRIGRAAALSLCMLALTAPGASAQVYTTPGAITTLPPIGSRTVPSQPGSEQGTTRQGLRFEPSIFLEETWTSNANFDRGNSTERRSDWVTQITPGFIVDANGAHSRLNGSVFLPVFLYARTGGDNNRVLPDVHITGTADAFDRHLFLDAGADVHREFLSAFGGQPISAVTNSQNEYTSQAYRIAPTLRGELPGYARYEVSDLNLWTRSTNAPTSLNDAYTNDLKASVARDPLPFGVGANYELGRVLFTNGPTQKTEIVRLHGDYAPDPQVQLSAIAGYEDDDYANVHFNNAVYGVGVRWRPGERTSLDATWEHRFFGSGYHVTFDHRTALTAWTLVASRDITNYPQQLLALGAGADVNSVLNLLFTSRFPDPLQRQQLVDNLTRTYALPPVLPGAVNLYTQNVTLVTNLSATAGFVGARNNVYVTIYRVRNQSIVPVSAQVGELLDFNDVTQTGTSALWSTRLTPTLTMTTQLNGSHSTGNLLNTDTRTRTNNASAVVTLITPLSPLTDFHVGARYQTIRSNVQLDAEEGAVFVGILHRFH